MAAISSSPSNLEKNLTEWCTEEFPPEFYSHSTLSGASPELNDPLAAKAKSAAVEGREKAARAIKKAFDEKETALLLSCCKLFSLPSCVWDLTHLETLDISCNNLRELSSKVSQLVNLKILNCIINDFTHIPKEIGQLKNLQVFRLSKNHELTEIPPFLAALPNTCLLDVSCRFFGFSSLSIEEFLRVRKGVRAENSALGPKLQVFMEREKAEEILVGGHPVDNGPRAFGAMGPGRFLAEETWLVE